MSAIDVSVIVPAWKAASFVERSVASALASTGVTVEVIVVDDASPDDTHDVLERIAAADPRVIVDRLPKNAGPSAARNRALELSKGRYIAILDADDTMAAGRLATLVAIADETRADIVVDNMLEVAETGETAAGKPFLTSTTFAAARDIDLATWVRFNQPMKPGDCLGYLKPLIRRTKLEDGRAAGRAYCRESRGRGVPHPGRGLSRHLRQPTQAATGAPLRNPQQLG